MRRRFMAIMNPVSGRRKMRPLVEEIGYALRRRGAALEIAETQHAGHGTELAKQAESVADAVLVVGGDGTVGEVVNGLVGLSTPFAILGTGTENLLARELGMPKEPAGIIDRLLNGNAAPLDVGLINDRRFLAVAGVGFDADCVVRMTQTRKGHITHFDYFWPIWRSFWAYRFPRFQVTVDGERVFDGRGLAVLGGIGQYSGGMRILKKARFDDGLLDVCIMACESHIGLAGHGMRALTARHMTHRSASYHQGQEIRVDSDEAVAVEADGDVCGELPITCRIMPAAARYLAANSQHSR